MGLPATIMSTFRCWRSVFRDSCLTDIRLCLCRSLADQHEHARRPATTFFCTWCSFFHVFILCVCFPSFRWIQSSNPTAGPVQGFVPIEMQFDSASESVGLELSGGSALLDSDVIADIASVIADIASSRPVCQSSFMMRWPCRSLCA